MYERHFLEERELTEKVKEVVLSPEILRLASQIAKESCNAYRSEQGGFIGGIVNGGSFLVFDNLATSIGTEGNCVLYDRENGIRNLDLGYYRELIKLIPNFKTVRYHSHPRVTAKNLIEEIGNEAGSRILQDIEEELGKGIFGSLGIKDVDGAVNESFSRQLSPADLSVSFGRYQLLISPTFYSERTFSHLNFYDLLDDQRLVPIRLAKAGEMRDINSLEKRVHKGYRTRTFGTDDFFSLSPEELKEIFLKIHHGD